LRYEVIKRLADTTDFISGESVSAAIGITRAALWKHVKAMQNDGAQIESATNKGYRLIAPPDVPRAEYVKAYLTTNAAVFYEPSTPSTNDTAKQAAQDKHLTRAVFIAGEQTAGKGRKGRRWVSPMGDGLYLSFLVRPTIETERVSGLTLMAAVALCRAIEKTAGTVAGIKWPNDILIGNKKVAGILTESMLGMDGVEYVVCGMGINVNQNQFEDELKDKACSLLMSGRSVNKTLLAAEIIDTFFNAYDQFMREGLKAFMPVFREMSAICGEVTIVSPSGSDTGLFLGYDDTGAILIDCSGETKRFIAGEVSLRGDNGYV
jgi:BirA family biotin operon repressor/biotin-[acetyl-CoA-carboxylase] ligase